jgi:flavin-dependent dehydrogenase
MVMRDRFDASLATLAARAGADLLDGVRVQAVEENDRAVVVRTSAGSFRAAYLVGADGANSTVARALNLITGVDLHPTLSAELYPNAADVDARYQKMGLYDLGVIPGGYAWAFPKSDHYSVGVSGFRSTVGKLHSRFRRFVKTHPFLGSCRVDRIQGWFIPISSNGDAAVSRRTVLIGDAAGCVDPFTGEGIAHALKGGALAAAFLGQRLREGAGPGLASFRSLLKREILNDLRIGRFLGSLFYRFPRLAFRLVLKDSRAVRHFARLMAGESDYRTILKLFLRYWYKANWLERL